MFKLTTTRTLLMATLGLALTGVPGCDKDSKKESAGSTAKPVAAKAIDLGSINDAVPQGITLSFTNASLDDGVEAIVPVGWEASKIIPGSYRPPSDAGLGFFTKFKVGSGCDGMCQKKDWAKVVASSEFGRVDDATIVKDEKLDTENRHGRLVVVEADDRLRIIAAWWKSEASQYVYCRAELDGKARDAVNAFEQACRGTRW